MKYQSKLWSCQLMDGTVSGGAYPLMAVPPFTAMYNSNEIQVESVKLSAHGWYGLRESIPSHAVPPFTAMYNSNEIPVETVKLSAHGWYGLRGSVPSHGRTSIHSYVPLQWNSTSRSCEDWSPWMVQSQGQRTLSWPFLPFMAMYHSNGIVPGKSLNSREAVSPWLCELRCKEVRF